MITPQGARFASSQLRIGPAGAVGDDEEEQGGDHGDGAVGERILGQIGRDERQRDPGGDGQGDERDEALLGDRPGAGLADSGAGGGRIEVGRRDLLHLHQDRPAQRHRDEDERDSVERPGQEIDPEAGRLLDDPGGDGVGRRADQGAEAADRRGEGDAHGERSGEAVGLAGLDPGGAKHGEADRHHDEGGGGVGDDGAEQGGRGHEGEQHLRRPAAAAADDGESEAAVEAGPLDRQSDDRAAEHEEQDRRIISRRGIRSRS